MTLLSRCCIIPKIRSPFFDGTNLTFLPPAISINRCAIRLWCGSLFRCAASYVDKILKGARPADLPIEQPTKFELVVSLRTAKKFDLAVLSSLLATADEVIE